MLAYVVGTKIEYSGETLSLTRLLYTWIYYKLCIIQFQILNFLPFKKIGHPKYWPMWRVLKLSTLERHYHFQFSCYLNILWIVYKIGSKSCIFFPFKKIGHPKCWPMWQELKSSTLERHFLLLFYIPIKLIKSIQNSDFFSLKKNLPP